MADINQIFDGDMGQIWVQPDGPNTEVFPLFCLNSDGLDESRGEPATRMGRKATGWQALARSRGLPSDTTFSLEAYVWKDEQWLEKNWNDDCEWPVYFHQGHCEFTSFWDFQRGQLAQEALAIGRTPAGLLRGTEDQGGGAADAMKHTYNYSAIPYAPVYYPVLTNMLAFSTEGGVCRDIAFARKTRCKGPCGSKIDTCDYGVAVFDNDGAATANVYYTTDGWATPNLSAAQPFAISEAISTCEMYWMDNDTIRILVGCGTAAAAFLRVAYSDDYGANWTVVALNAVATDYFIHSGGLFMLDNRHIWAGSFEADIYFSKDGGVTWTDQEAPEPAVAAESIYWIDFVDEMYGMAVGGDIAGNTAALYQTNDGGDHWSLLATEPAVDCVTSVTVLNAHDFWVTMDSGELWFTEDWGLTYEEREFVTTYTPTRLSSIHAIDDYGIVLGGTDATHGLCWRTVNGGYSWEEHRYPTAWDALAAFGVNSVWACDYSHWHVVGELVGALPIHWMLQNVQPNT